MRLCKVSNVVLWPLYNWIKEIRSTKWAKHPWKNKNKSCKRTKYKKVFIIYEILDCSIKRKYSLIFISNSSSKPINTSNNSSRVTNISLLINWNCFLFDFLDPTFCKYFPQEYFSPEFNVWNKYQSWPPHNLLYLLLWQNKQGLMVHQKLMQHKTEFQWIQIFVMLPRHLHHLVTKNRHRCQPCCEFVQLLHI